MQSSRIFRSWVPFVLISLAVVGAGGMALPAYHLIVDAPKNGTERKERELVRDLLKKTSVKSEEVKWNHQDGENKGERIVRVTLKAKNDFGMEVTSTMRFDIKDGKVVKVDID